MPLLIVIFGSASYWYAYVTKGGDVVVNQVGVLDVSPNDRNARLYDVFGVFSPGKTSYNIKLPSGMSGSPTPGSFDVTGQMGSLDPTILDLDDPPQIRDFNVAAWAMRSFITTGRIGFDKKPTISLRYTKVGIEGSIKNNLPYNLTDAFLIDGKRIYKMGTLRSGAIKAVAVKFSKTIPPDGPIGVRAFSRGKGHARPADNPVSFSQKTLLEMEMMNQIFGYDGDNLPKLPTLIAWTSRQLVTPEILGKKPVYRGSTMLLLPVEIDTTDFFAINQQKMHRTIVNKTGTVRNNGRWSLSFNKTVEFEYRLPVDRPYAPVSIAFMVSAMGVPQAYKIHVFNFRLNAFSAIKPSKDWMNIKPPAEYISQDNTIRVKLVANKNQWGELTNSSLNFEVYGKWQN
jgi:hypothetical protein